MTPQQINTKIAELDTWLKKNHNHKDRHLVENDKKALQLRLQNLEKPKP